MQLENAASPFIDPSDEYIYILPSENFNRLKIGRSSHPLERIAGLCRIYPEIDLSRAIVIAVDHHCVETILHSVFGLRRQSHEVRADGYTEWFEGKFETEALELIQSIARHRGVKYRVFNDIDLAMQAYRAKNPNAGQRAPRQPKAKRLENSRLAQAELRQRVHAQTMHFIDVLAERQFDAVVHHNGNLFLKRTVTRHQEPQFWQENQACRSTEWGRHLTKEGQVIAQAQIARCIFYFVLPVAFICVSPELGHEYLRIGQERPRGDRPSVWSIIDEAFAEFWNVLSDLPLIESPHDPRTGPAVQSLLVEEAM